MAKYRIELFPLSSKRKGFEYHPPCEYYDCNQWDVELIGVGQGKKGRDKVVARFIVYEDPDVQCLNFEQRQEMIWDSAMRLVHEFLREKDFEALFPQTKEITV